MEEYIVNDRTLQADGENGDKYDEYMVLDGIAEGATKVEASEIPGYVKIRVVDTRVVEIATDEEVAAMLARVFGTEEP